MSRYKKITPKRLKKIGFEFDGEKYYRYYKKCRLTLYESVENKGYWYVDEIKMDGFNLMQYMHELELMFFVLTGNVFNRTLTVSTSNIINKRINKRIKKSAYW